MAEWLRSRRHDAVHVRDRGLSEAPDLQIWATVCQERRVLVTKDIDFRRLQSDGGAAQVVWVRIGNCRNDQLLRRLERSWPRVMKRLEAGEALVEIR